MLTHRSTPHAADNQPADGRITTRFWVGTFGAFVTTCVLALVAVFARYALVEGYNRRTQPGEGDHARG